MSSVVTVVSCQDCGEGSLEWRDGVCGLCGGRLRPWDLPLKDAVALYQEYARRLDELHEAVAQFVETIACGSPDWLNTPAGRKLLGVLGVASNRESAAE